MIVGLVLLDEEQVSVSVFSQNHHFHPDNSTLYTNNMLPCSLAVHTKGHVENAKKKDHLFVYLFILPEVPDLFGPSKIFPGLL